MFVVCVIQNVIEVTEISYNLVLSHWNLLSQVNHLISMTVIHQSHYGPMLHPLVPIAKMIWVMHSHGVLDNVLALHKELLAQCDDMTYWDEPKQFLHRCTGRVVGRRNIGSSF